MKNVSSLKANLTRNYNERLSTETSRASSESKIALLNRAYKRFQNSAVLEYFLEHDLSFDFMNAQTADNKIFNMKALDKVARIAVTLQTSKDALDNFTRSIIRNARALATQHNVSALTNADLQASLCASVESEHRARFVQCAKATAATASSQFSSSRAALVVLNLASIANKDTRNELTSIDTSVFSAVA